MHISPRPPLAAFLFPGAPMLLPLSVLAQTSDTTTKTIETVFGASVDKLILVFCLALAAFVLVQAWSSRNLINNLMDGQRKRDDELIKDKIRAQEELDMKDRHFDERHKEFLGNQADTNKILKLLTDQDSARATDLTRIKNDVSKLPELSVQLQDFFKLAESLKVTASTLQDSADRFEKWKSELDVAISTSQEIVAHLTKIKQDTGELPPIIPLEDEPPEVKAS